jgi:hypothetical protein
MRLKMMNPFFWLLAAFTKNTPAFTQREKDIKQNCGRVRDHIRDYI